MKNAPQVLAETQVRHQRRLVIPQRNLFALTWRGQLVTIKDVSLLTGSKYPQTTWTQLGSARSQCAKFNSQFGTQDFEIVELTIK